MDTKDKEKLNQFAHAIQKYLETNPTVVLGSGASVPYGLPSMSQLGESILNDTVVQGDPDYTIFKSKISDGLETAIDSASLKDETLDRIRVITWEEINKKDLAFPKERKYAAFETMIRLLHKLTNPSPNRATIVTTNYDRVVEYAADILKFAVINGFEGDLIRHFKLPTSESYNIRRKNGERTVEVWKVHGSLDWFISNDGTRNIISVALRESIPDGFSPLLIPPGKNKYKTAYEEPYRSIIAQSDAIFERSSAFLCVGYGFNDDHLQPKLIEQIKCGKPIVVLAKTMTESCRRQILNSGIQHYIICEYLDDAYTTIYHDGKQDKLAGQFWSLDNFLKIW